jgi:hypothetical protein
MPLPPCGRCAIAIAGDVTRRCWWCGKPLCSTCGDREDHCGHSSAEVINAYLARVTTYADQARVGIGHSQHPEADAAGEAIYRKRRAGSRARLIEAVIRKPPLRPPSRSKGRSK